MWLRDPFGFHAPGRVPLRSTVSEGHTAIAFEPRHRVLVGGVVALAMRHRNGDHLTFGA